MNDGRSFLDTNVLVYTDDQDSPEKKRRALELFATLRRRRRWRMRSFAARALLFVLVGGSAAVATAEGNRHVRLKSRDAKDVRPFDDAVRVGNTLYLAGRIGLDAATQKPPADAAAEVRNVMDQIKSVLAQEGMTMDDLVTV